MSGTESRVLSRGGVWCGKDGECDVEMCESTIGIGAAVFTAEVGETGAFGHTDVPRLFWRHGGLLVGAKPVHVPLQALMSRFPRWSCGGVMLS